MKKITIFYFAVFFTLFAVTSCTDDFQDNAGFASEQIAEIDRPVSQEGRYGFVFDKATYQNHRDQGASAVGSNIAPSEDMLQKIYDLLIAYDDQDAYIQNMMSQYGFPDWDNSILKGDEAGANFVTIPMVSNDRVTSAIKYYQHSDQHEIRFATRESVDQIIKDGADESEIDYARGIVFDFALLDYYVSNYTTVPYIEWYEANKNSETSSNGIQQRSIYYCNENCVDWFQYDPSTGTWRYIGSNCNLECYWLDPGFHNIPVSGGTNTGPSGPGGPNNPNNNPVTSTPPSTENDDDDKLSDAVEECIEAGRFRFESAVKKLQTSFETLSCDGEDINDMIARAVNNLRDDGDCGNLERFLRDISSNECLFSVFPISCESYKFENVGPFQVSRVTGIDHTFIDPQAVDYKVCPYEYEIGAPNLIYVADGSGPDRSIYSVTAGISANAAAQAHNLATSDVQLHFAGLPSGSLDLIQCSEMEAIFIEAFNQYFPTALYNQVVNKYQINPFDFYEFEITPFGGIDFEPDPMWDHIEAIDRISDISSLTGHATDNCAN